MRAEIDFEKPPAGYSINAAQHGQDVRVQYLEFTSTEDGQHFIQRLEGFPSEVLGKLQPQIAPSQVDSLLAICRRDGKALVFVNEPIHRVRMCAAREIKAGSIVTRNDIVDIDRLDFDVQIPKDAGVLFLFSLGWRKGLYYDFGPLCGLSSQLRTYDIATVIGQAYCHVLFQERFSISDAEWNALFVKKWFPFVGLGNATIDKLIEFVRCGFDPDDLLNEISDAVKDRATEILRSWQRHPSFAPHMGVLERSIERFQQGDYLSCTGLIFPRIEGILRTHHTSLGTSDKATQGNLTKSAVATKMDNEKCLLLPHRFAAYLRDVYFADFNPIAQNIDVSRHSVAHGVAIPSAFNLKSALLGILVCHQLFYFLENDQNQGGQYPVTIDVK